MITNNDLLNDLKSYIDFNDKEFCIKAACKNIFFITILLENLRTDKDFMKSILTNDNLNLESFSDMINIITNMKNLICRCFAKG